MNNTRTHESSETDAVVSLQSIFVNISNAFIGFLDDFGESKSNPYTEDGKLASNDRLIYLSILIIVLLIVGHVLFA